MPKVVPEQIKIQAVKRYLDGERTQDLSRQFGVSQQAVIGWIRKIAGDDKVRASKRYGGGNAPKPREVKPLDAVVFLGNTFYSTWSTS